MRLDSLDEKTIVLPTNQKVKSHTQRFDPMEPSRLRGRKPILGKGIRDALFTKHPTIPDIWNCRCGKSRKQMGSGYSNLMSHVRDKHPETYKKLTDV